VLTPGPVVISATGVSKQYWPQGGPPVDALRQVCFSAAGGELVAVTGPSGSGKTTLLNLLGGMDRPSAGSVCIEGRDLSALDDRSLSEVHRKRVGFVPRSFDLLPELRAWENVALSPLLDGASLSAVRPQAEELLACLLLAQSAQRFPSELSDGERQRVALARALFHHPVLVLADEPTGNLDPAARRSVLELVSRRVDEGCCVVVATHDPELAGAAHRVVQLRDGAVVP